MDICSFPTQLDFFMKYFGSDKTMLNGHHNYCGFYDKLFYYKRYSPHTRVFELGIGSKNTEIESNMSQLSETKIGGSLLAWRAFFPSASIFGADIDRDILFDDERIKTYYVDQRDKESIISLWENEELQEKFDIIIDDGLHDPDANRLFLELSLHKLKDDGFYIIEDVSSETLLFWENQIYKMRETMPEYNFMIMEFEYKNNEFDNRMILINKKGV